MKQKMIIDVEAPMNLSSCGDNYMLIFDSTKGYYTVTTREAFLAPQNAKIEQLEKDFIETKNNFKVEYEKFREESENKYNEFLKVYKNTNAKMITMIKTFISGGKEE